MPFLAPNSLAALETAVSTHSPLLGRAVHAQIIRTVDSPIIPPFLSNHLINMYSKLDLLNSAQLVLSLSPTHTRSVVTWTALISGSVQNGHFHSAILYFSNMRRESIQPNDFTFPCAFKASHRLPGTGKQIHCLAVKLGQIDDIYVGCSAFDMYSKIGLRKDACKVFDEMPEKNLTTWNAYISNSVLDGQPQKAIGAFIEYRCRGGEPNSITFCAFLNACSDAFYLELGRQLHGYVVRNGYEGNVCVANGLIDFYGKCREINSSELVFDGIHNRNDVSWCSIVAAYEQNDEGEKACMTFLHARSEMVEMKDFMVSSVLSACAAIGGLELGRSVHAVAVKACIDRNVFVGSALVDMYGKCGSLEDCESAFDEMPERNVITWNALIGGYSHQGYADMALALYEDMTNGGLAAVVPNYVTFVCVLAACSRAGLWKVGLKIFESMRERFGIEPGREHYTCVVDMLGRAGMVDRAYNFINQMPIHPTISIWGALLGACKVHGHRELGKIAADNLFQLDPHDSGNHVLLSNMFAAAGRYNHSQTAARNSFVTRYSVFA